MHTVSEAAKIILNHALALGREKIPLNEALGRILGEDLVADRDFPPFDRVTMDGIAIRHEQFAQGRRNFAIKSIQAAGAPQQQLSDPAGCIEVMTGAMLPDGTDTVIQYEQLKIENSEATILAESVNFRQNIHFKGIDRKAKDCIVSKGKKNGAGGNRHSRNRWKICLASFPAAPNGHCFHRR